MYYVYTDSSCQTVLQQINGSDAVLTTDANGNTDTVAIPAGTYYVKETTASEGYLLCDGDNPCSYSKNGVHEVTVTTDNTEDNPATVKCEETPGNDPAGITLYKLDSETGEAWAQGDTDLSGAQFTIKYYDGYYDEDTLPETATRTWVVETKYVEEYGTYAAQLLDDCKVSGDDLYYDWDGIGVVLPLGTYTVQETLAPEGYLLEGQTRPADSSYTAPVHLGQVTQSGNEVQALSIGNEIETPEPVIRGGVEVQKRDVESLRDDPQGNGSFEGITLEITNKSEAAVMVDSDGDGVLEKFEPGEVVMTLTTDGNGYAATSSDALPYGSYTITETAVPGVTDHRMLESEQDDGYLLGSDDGATYEANTSIDFTIREEGVIVNLTGAETENGESVVSEEKAITDQVKRGDITLTKHDETTQEGMSVPFRVTSLTTGESHVFWTDENGDYSSDSTWNAHSYMTDAGEDYSDGLWFYGYEDWESFVTLEYDEEGHILPEGGYVDDGVGALPYDNYRIDELRCEANKGKELVHTTFTVDQDIRVLNLGQYYNGDAPYIHTDAWASDTGTQLCYVGGDNGDGWVTLYDDVHYYNLTPGQTYGIYGVALDADTREPEYDHYGNEICAWTTFTADGTGSGMEIQEFYFDVEDLSGHRVVFFETIFAVDEDGNVLYTDDETSEYYPYQFYVAEDPDDYLAQTIYFPQVGTELTDSGTGTHYAEADGVVTLTDNVAVTEVPEGETVTIYGTMMDKVTGEPLVDADGNTVTASGTYVSPGLETWYAELTFTFDASALTGNGAVAYEDLYQLVDSTEILVGRHADLDDEDQTVYFPSIYTAAVDSETQSHISFADGEVTIIDTVEYENLVAGETYTMQGVLMDKDTGEPLLDDDGNEITAEVTFVAGETAEDTEIVDVEITEDGADADDADAEDTGDSDTGETADETDVDDADAEDTEDSDAEEAADETDADDADAEDAAGDTDAGEAEDETDAEDTGSGETAEGSIVSGSVEMVFTFPAETLAGKAAVAYEYLYHDGTPVTEHTDIDDESQTVWFPAISTTATDAEDGDDTLIAGPVSVNDRVDYTGLIAGRQYVMAGTLMDKATGEAVLVDGEAATAQIEFTPETSDGYVTLSVTADASGMEGESLVMFEKCYLLGDDGVYVEVAAHEDLNDKAQTVKVKNPVGGGGTVTTGLRNFGLIAVIGAAALAAALALIRRRRRAW